MKRLFKVGSDRHDVGPVTFSWHPAGNFLASAGKNGIVQITDRHGEIVDEIPMQTTPSPILSLAWDKDGDYLAVLQEGNGTVPLWSLTSRKLMPLETNLKDPTFISWSKSGPQLAIGTAKGNLLIYNKDKKQKFPIVGKHGKKICCGAWTKKGNKLVLGSEDKTLTISSEVGDTLIHTELKYVPRETYFSNHRGSEMRADGIEPGTEDDTVSANLGGKSLLLFNIQDDSKEPMELTFAARDDKGNCKYGDLVRHQWYDEDLLMIGFSEGWIVVVSTKPNDIGEEKHSSKFHPSLLVSFAYNAFLKKVATAGEDGVRIIDTREFKESRGDYIAPLDLEDGRVTDLCWSPDGQILTVGTDAGNIYNFLAKMTVLNATYKTTVAYLSSLREVSIIDVVRRTRPIDVMLKLEPALLAVGGRHVAAGMNGRVYFHRIGTKNDGQPVHEQEYQGTLRRIILNLQYAAVLTDTKVTIHPIEPGVDSQRQTKTFPSREESSFARVTSIALTDDFLYYGTEAGTLEVFYLPEWITLTALELRLTGGVSIRQIYPNAFGTRIVIVDSSSRTYLFNPVSGGGVDMSLTEFDDAPSSVVSVLWDTTYSNVVMLFDGKELHTYTYAPISVKGPLLAKLGPVEISDDGSVALVPSTFVIPASNTPILCTNGTITCQTIAGSINPMVHPCFEQITTPPPSLRKKQSNADALNLRSKFGQALGLVLMDIAWQVALELDKRQFWLALSNKAMELLNVELAMRVYRQLGDAGMVMALQECQMMEDKYVLAGQISLLFCEYSRAQDFFLTSTEPTRALQMRCDLLQWDVALNLARKLDLTRVPEISVKYAQQLEFQDRPEEAKREFENALSVQDEEGNSLCSSALGFTASVGITRCSIRLGDYKRGMRLARELNDKTLFGECGEILETVNHKQYADAAEMFLKAENYERAAFMYTNYLLKDRGLISQAAAIMEKVKNDQIHSAFAKHCVAAGRFDEAAKAFARAKDMDKVVELKLRKLDQVPEAFQIVRDTCSAQGAVLVAEFCQEDKNYRGAIEFLLMANKSDEAFRLAQQEGLVETYSSILGDSIQVEDAKRVASHYEKFQDFGKAGRFYSLCGQYQKALKLFLQCGDKEIDAAIDVVGKSQNESLTHQLIDYLVGDKDGVPKDPNYIYRLYIALRKYEDAAKTALIIARQEQDMGNYALAHSVIVETIRQLEDEGIKVSLNLRTNFVLLHSYILVKRLVKSGNHSGAARMLLRVAQSVSKFPLHSVPILTSTVIECQRAGLKASSYEYAVMLMRPENRSVIDQNLKRKIEAIVRRKSQNVDDSPEETSPCPISGQMIANTQLECPSTRDALPMCVVTGRHMVLDDWCFCPVSKFPALMTEYIRYIEAEMESIPTPTPSTDDGDEPETKSARGSIQKTHALDPVLGKPVTVADLKRTPPEDAMKYIQRYNNVKDEKEGEGDEGGEEDGGDLQSITSKSLATEASGIGKSSKDIPKIRVSKSNKPGRKGPSEYGNDETE